nr:hypothetical protein [Tanacetum cinerariifolium]
MKMLFTINPCPRLMENANTIVETLPSSPIPVQDGDSQREDIDIFTSTDELLPPSIESDDDNSEEDIHFLEELLSDDFISIPENESSNFDNHDDPSFPRPPSKPPDIEIFFEPDSGVLTTNVVKGISEHYVLMTNILPTLPTFDLLYPVYDTLFPIFFDFDPDMGVLTAKTVEDISEHYLLMPKVLPTLCLNIDTLLPFSSENEDKVFKHGILSFLLVSHRDKIIFDFSENPMMMYGEDIPVLDVLFLHFYPP